MQNLLLFLRSSGIFFVGSVLSKAIIFLLLPIYTALISPSDYGYVDLSIVTVTLMVEVVFLNMWVVLLRQMYHNEDEPLTPVRTGLVLFGASLLLFLTLGIIVALTWAPHYIGWILGYGVAEAFLHLFKHVCRGLKHNVDFAVSGILGTLTTVLVNILLLVYMGWDYSSLYIAFIVSACVEMTYIEIRVGIVRRLLRLKGDALCAADIKALFLLAVPVGLNALVFWFVNSFNRAVVTDRLGLEDVGFLAIAMQFGNILMLVIMAMTFAWQDLAFRRGKGDAVFFGKASTAYITALLVGVSMLLPAVAVLFPYMVNPKYASTFVLVPVALLLAAMRGYSNFLVNIFYAIDDNMMTFYALFVEAVVNTSLVVPLILVMGVQGALVSTTVAFTVGCAFMLWRLRVSIGARMRLRFPVMTIPLLLGSTYVYLFAGYAWNLIVTILMTVLVLIGAAYVLNRRLRARRVAD